MPQYGKAIAKHSRRVPTANTVSALHLSVSGKLKISNSIPCATHVCFCIFQHPRLHLGRFQA